MRRPHLVLSLLVLVCLASVAPTRAGRVQWANPRLLGCETNAVFYSSSHVVGRRPCCALIEGLCPGGVTCPVSGMCPNEAVACQPSAVTARPNVVLMITDDQAACHYGHAGECRSAQSGTPIPAPVTPNLDLLAGFGTVFPVAHNTSAWCLPSLNSIVTGRQQRSFAGQRRVGEAFHTIPRVLRHLEGEGGTTPDPYDAQQVNVIGGYCTFLAGKFAGSIGDVGFDGRAQAGERRIGRNDCIEGASPGDPPQCGTDAVSAYDPVTLSRMGDLFEFLDGLVYRVPDSVPQAYAMQHFFTWYAPRIPHQPLTSPIPIGAFLFGDVPDYPLGGEFNLEQYCAGPACAAQVPAFQESNFGTVRELYANLWWVDDNIREIRKFLAYQSTPHCIGPNGRSLAFISNPIACAGFSGTWTNVTPDLERNTVIIQLSDNGWHLPDSKHHYTENGRRTRVVVFDPTAGGPIPNWDPAGSPPPPAQESQALVQTADLLPTILSYARNAPPGTIACPVSSGTPCDGRDLRAHLATNPGGPSAPEALRHSLCGHHTQKGTLATDFRHLLTRQGSVGRCTDSTAPACVLATDCGVGEACLGGHCLATAEPACNVENPCATGAVCLGGRCRVAPACVDDVDCAGLFPGGSTACVEKASRWCGNAPSVACATRDDCPECPAVGGNPTACRRVCESRQLKYYTAPGKGSPALPAPQLTDLLLDPDEDGLHFGNAAQGKLVFDISKPDGPYAGLLRRLNCCLDDWWSDPVTLGGTLCQPGDTCPADLVCEQ